jgi:hypothetical protein
MTSVLDRGEWSTSRSGRFTPGARAPCTHWVGGWVDPRAGLDNVENGTFLTLPRLELRLLVVCVGSRYTDCAIQAPKELSRNARMVAPM